VLTGGELEIECRYTVVYAVWLNLSVYVNKQTETVSLPDRELFFENRVGGGSKGTELLQAKGEQQNLENNFDSLKLFAGCSSNVEGHQL